MEFSCGFPIFFPLNAVHGRARPHLTYIAGNMTRIKTWNCNQLLLLCLGDKINLNTTDEFQISVDRIYPSLDNSLFGSFHCLFLDCQTKELVLPLSSQSKRHQWRTGGWWGCRKGRDFSQLHADMLEFEFFNILERHG